MGIPTLDGEDTKRIIVIMLSSYRRSDMLVVKLSNYEDKTKIILNKMKSKWYAKDADARHRGDVPFYINNHTTRILAAFFNLVAMPLVTNEYTQSDCRRKDVW